MSHQVIITQFVNPHLFYFSKINTPRYVHIKTKLSNIERKITAKLNSKSVPKVGTLVCVMYISWKRLIRGRVEKVQKNSSDNTEYLIWALDYGFFFLTNRVHIFDLPTGCAETYNHIKRGGIAYLMPLERNGYPIYEISTMFLESTNIFSRDILENAYDIHFLHGYKMDGQYWGDLNLENADGTFKSMFMELKNGQYGVYHHSFLTDCKRLITNKIFPQYVNTDRLNCKENQFSAANRYLYEEARSGLEYELHGKYEEDVAGNETLTVSDDSISSIDEPLYQTNTRKRQAEPVSFQESIKDIKPSGVIAIDIHRKWDIALKILGLEDESSRMFSNACDRNPICRDQQ